MRFTAAIVVVALWTTTAAPAPPPALARYVGKYPFDKVAGVTFLHHALVRRAVNSAVLEPAVKAEVLADAVTTPIEQRSSMIVSRGCRPHNCGDVSWTIAILATGAHAAVCYHNSDLMGDESHWFVAGSPKLRVEGRCETDVPPQVVAALTSTK